MKRRLHLAFPERLSREPVLHTLGRRFDVVTNIRRASIDERSAWVILEMEGSDEVIAGAVAWLSEQGVRVDRVGEEEEA